MNAVVIGGGLAGLVAARELLRRGEVVDLYEASDHLGGVVAPVRMGDVVVDGGAEAFAVRTSTVTDLCAELGLEIADPQGQPHIWWPEAPHRWPLANGVLGIPGSLEDPAIVAALTPDELAESVRDLQMGGDVAADETKLGPLVEARLGVPVVERLVAPLVRGVYGRSPNDIDVDVMAPGLRDAMREHGSLVAAVSAIRTPGAAAVAQPVGGLFRLVDALAADIEQRGGHIHLEHPVIEWHHDHHGWEIRTKAGPLRAGRVILAVHARAAAELFALLGESVEVPPSHPSFQAVVALTHKDIATGPVGSGVIVGRRDDALVARALTHYSLKWPWSAQGNHHVLRLAYAATPTRAQVVADASLLLGIDLRDDDVSGFEVLHWEMPTSLTPDARAALVDKLAKHDGLGVTGAWVAGNGIAAVVAAATQVVA